MVWPILAIGGAVITALGAAATGSYHAYKYFTRKEVGSFVIWGRVDAGKSTFTHWVRTGKTNGNKIASESIDPCDDIPLILTNDKEFKVKKIYDLPGTAERMRNWKDLLLKCEHGFYFINLSRLDDKEYLSQVRVDLRETLDYMNTVISKESNIKSKLKLVFSHLDKSKWKSIGDGQVVNKLSEDAELRKIFEMIDSYDASFKYYAANLTSEKSLKHLVFNIMREIDV